MGKEVRNQLYPLLLTTGFQPGESLIEGMGRTNINSSLECLFFHVIGHFHYWIETAFCILDDRKTLY